MYGIKKQRYTKSYYNQLKFNDYEKYFGESKDTSAYTSLVFFKQCNNTVEENTLNMLRDTTEYKIDLDRSIYSDKLRGHLLKINKELQLNVCSKCFHIGVNDALQNS